MTARLELRGKRGDDGRRKKMEFHSAHCYERRTYRSARGWKKKVTGAPSRFSGQTKAEYRPIRTHDPLRDPHGGAPLQRLRQPLRQRRTERRTGRRRHRRVRSSDCLRPHKGQRSPLSTQVLPRARPLLRPPVHRSMLFIPLRPVFNNLLLARLFR